jgi:molecular chaperone GrpE (heat shock protein)
MTKSIREIKQQCHAYRGQLKLMEIKTSRRHLNMLNFLENRHQELEDKLSGFPAFCDEVHREMYKGFKHSFEVLEEQVRILNQGMAPIPILTEYQRDFPQDAGLEEWLDCLEDMEVSIEDYEREIELWDQARLLSIVELLDSAERITKFEVPEPKAGGEVYYRYLERLRAVTGNFSKRLRRFLGGFNVELIDLRIGSYPPIEKTRIVGREDGGTCGDVVITQVVENGYLWNGKILRKAAVIIADRKE